MQLEALLNSTFYQNYEKMNRVFSPTPFSSEDAAIAQQVGLDVSYYKKKYNLPKESFDLNIILSKSLYAMDSIGCIACMDSAVSLLNNLEYSCTDSDTSLFATLSEIEETKAGFAKRARYIIVPEKFTPASPIFLSHEVSHVLKERNPKECKNIYTTQEVIPMLLELILAFSDKDKMIFRNLLDDRMALLSKEAENYFMLKIINERMDDTMYQAIQTAILMSAVYLNSFYYSLGLFQVYLSYPSFIKELIAAVLNLEMTTDEMIDVVERSVGDEVLNDGYFDGMNLVKSLL